MRWEGQRQSENVEDRRGAVGTGTGGGLRVGGRGLGLGTVAIALLAGWLFGINPLTVLGLLDGGGLPLQTAPQTEGAAGRPPADDREAAFVSTVLADTEEVWGGLFAAGGKTYQPPRLVLFRGSTPTACGRGEAAMGPFYCPADRKVYIDLAFNQTLSRELGAPGDFAQAYVIAHEVGHHIQHLLGISDKVQAQQQSLSEVQANAMSVRLELQADCLAGVWAHHSQQGKQWLETGDIDEALHAASRIGDDTLQREASGTVRPDSFTHGSSAQRMQWFQRGLTSGQTKDCNTFQ